jgi:hypothetical protein
MFRAERRAGELLAQLLPHGAGTLADLGIDSGQSSLWRREAANPAAAFEKYLARAKRLGEPITSDGLLRRRGKRNGRPSVTDDRHDERTAGSR